MVRESLVRFLEEHLLAALAFPVLVFASIYLFICFFPPNNSRGLFASAS